MRLRQRIIQSSLAAMLWSLNFSVEAQQATKIPRIGYLTNESLSATSDRSEAFRRGLRELGHVEGKNIFIEWRSAEGKLDRVTTLAAELVRLKVDVIVTVGSSVSRSAKEVTSTIPIVMAQVNDPVGDGLVASLARPGGNITGLSTLAPELSGKRLELLKEVVPKLSRVAVMGTSTIPGNAQQLNGTELAAGPFGIAVHYLDVLNPKEVESAFRGATKARAEALLGLGGPVLNSQRTQVVELAVKSLLPAVYWRSDFVEAGA
jgi:putative tryptophan/tyrosine transport system substrate-binding protein